MSRATILLVLLAVAGLTACGGDEPEALPTAPTTPTTSALPDPDSLACPRLLSDAAAAELAGAEPQPPVATKLGELDACRWDIAMGSWIQVVDVPAPQWAAQLPAALEEARSSGDFDVATLRTLEEGLAPLRRGGQLSPARSCALFSTFARKIVGAEGNDAVVNFVPDRTVPQAVNAQRCLGGRYTAVQLVSPDLLGENDEAARALNALAAIR